MSKENSRVHCLVTGGSSGIGAAVVGALVELGHAVSVIDLTAGNVPRVLYLNADVTDEHQVGAAFDKAQEEQGRITGVVTSAGVRGQFVPSLELNLKQARRLFDINVCGTLICAREFTRRLAGEAGAMVAVSSTTAYGGWQRQADYGTSKAAVSSLVRHLAVEWAEMGVNVNGIAPGHTHTPMVESMVKKEGYDLRAAEQRTPLGRLATPSQMAKQILHLLLRPGHVTGQILAVDGGWTVAGK